jgi:guanine deaminase
MWADHGELLRAGIFHTPGNPFRDEDGLQVFPDGGLLIAGGRILACGDYRSVAAEHPLVRTRDLRPGFLAPGFVDVHTHFPQMRIIGGLGHTLLDWLERCALPEEARMSDTLYARRVAREFIDGLSRNGTTTALVFGAHFAPATAALFETAASAGIRIVSGMVLSDRGLTPALHQTPAAAYEQSKALIQRFHGKSGHFYAVTPRFALSCSEAMLEVCRSLLDEHPGVLLQTHLNENSSEIAEVAKRFPRAKDYLDVYEEFNLVRAGGVFAHNVHPSIAELDRLAYLSAGVAYCPCSNAALGSGFFPMRRHLNAGVRFALGTDVGAGTGLGMLKEGLQAYLLQRLDPAGYPLTPAHLLYLCTRAGAELLGMDSEIGDLTPGKAADFVHLQAPEGGPLAAAISRAADPEQVLAALFTLGSPECVREVRVAGCAAGLDRR